MSQQNKLLFLAVCCYVLQAISCVETGNLSSSGPLTIGPRFSSFSYGSKSPQRGSFRPHFLSNKSLSFSNPISNNAVSIEQASEVPPPPRMGLPILRFNRSFSKSENESVKPEQPEAQLTAQNETQPVVPSELPITEETSKTEEESPKVKYSKKKSTKRKNSKSDDIEPSNKKNTNRPLSIQDDPLYISDRAQLIERAKDMIRNLIRDQNANRAVTRIVLNGRSLLENKVTSEFIKIFIDLMKNTMMNEEAKKIIEDLELTIAETFVNEKTPKKAEYVFSKLLQYLVNKDLPKYYNDRFGQMKNLINCKQTQFALKTFKDGFVKFIKSKDSPQKIEKVFDKVDKLLSLDFNVSNLLKYATGK